MLSRNSLLTVLVFVMVLSFTSSAMAFDACVSTANGFFKFKNYKMAFTHYDAYAKRCEKNLLAADPDDHYICIKSAEKKQLEKGRELLEKTFYCYYMAGVALEKLNKPADAVNYYVKALYMTIAYKNVTFIHTLTRKRTVKSLVFEIAPKDLNANYDRIYALGIDTAVLMEKIRAVAEIRRDLAKLIAGGIDPEKQDEYKARFAVCQKREYNLGVLLENLVVYEMNRGIYTRFDAFVKHINEFKPITPAVSSLLKIAEVMKQNLITIIAHSENPYSVPTLDELNAKLSGLSEIIDYINANIQ
ncbi:MAG TPA: hypothetical protein PKW98_01985 [Candidatus Wallbacteria bacterium]|nr:MAG: hypothetical protein BWY32_00718 [bacterium ADurb.Bin243]HOD39198.1 hypothetical protein [Candidatus Wallbacteria bacterium]HPG56563.1 hypothetical protein [Candidatus Wallbacteria bacterium]